MNKFTENLLPLFYKTDIELYDTFFLECVSKTIKENKKENCTICKSKTNYLCQIGQCIYSVCRGICEHKLADVLSYEIIHSKRMSKTDTWSPTSNFLDCSMVIDHINYLGYTIALVQLDDKWKCVTSKQWDKRNETYNILEDDPLSALTKMMITLQDIKDHPEDYYQD